MTPKRLNWKYIGRSNEHWIGTLPANYPPIRFTLERLSGDTHLIKSDVNDIQKKTCEGLENAKLQAQELFNAYAISLFVLNGNGFHTKS